MNCNKCGSVNTQRLEMVLQSGTQTIDLKSRTVGFIGMGKDWGISSSRTSSQGNSQTLIAQRCLPPQKQSLKTPVGLIVLFSLMFLASPYTQIKVFSIIAIGLCIYAGYKITDFNINKFPKNYQKWLKSWMCHQCGNVYHSQLKYG